LKWIFLDYGLDHWNSIPGRKNIFTIVQTGSGAHLGPSPIRVGIVVMGRDNVSV
jgi:hypothetical protein